MAAPHSSLLGPPAILFLLLKQREAPDALSCLTLQLLIREITIRLGSRGHEFAARNGRETREAEERERERVSERKDSR